MTPRELDFLIHRKVMGYEVDAKASAGSPEESWFEHPDTHYQVRGKNVPRYSGPIVDDSDHAVAKVVDKMREDGWKVVLRESAEESEAAFYRQGQTPPFDGYSYEDWPPPEMVVTPVAVAEEICVAALNALGA